MALIRFRVNELQLLMLLMALSLLIFAGAIVTTAWRPRAERLEAQNQARVRWMPTDIKPGAADARYTIAEMLDPSLIALPSRHGFSSRAWKHTAAATQRIIEPTREQAFLDASVETEMPLLLDEVAVTDTIQAAATKLPAEIDRPEANMDEPIPVLNQTVLSLEGALSRRPLAQRAALPVVTSATPLRSTRVRLAVAPDGTVRYYTLDRSSGNEAVDTQALEFLRQLRFEPHASPDPMALTWGTAKFFWAANPPESK